MIKASNPLSSASTYTPTSSYSTEHVPPSWNPPDSASITPIEAGKVIASWGGGAYTTHNYHDRQRSTRLVSPNLPNLSKSASPFLVSCRKFGCPNDKSNAKGIRRPFLFDTHKIFLPHMCYKTLLLGRTARAHVTIRFNWRPTLLRLILQGSRTPDWVHIIARGVGVWVGKPSLGALDVDRGPRHLHCRPHLVVLSGTSLAWVLRHLGLQISPPLLNGRSTSKGASTLSTGTGFHLWLSPRPGESGVCSATTTRRLAASLVSPS